MKKKIIFVAIFGIILLPAVIFIKTSSADFYANNLIEDSIFDNYNSMNAQQIDAFLNNNFPSSCISTSNGFTAPALTGYSPSTGYTYGGNVSAGQVIASASQAYRINPQVILATLEKESSVVSGTASYRCQYINTSMGYDCPDSGSCPQNPATESGFSKQIIHAVWLMKFDEQHAKGNYNWAEIHDSWDNSDDIGACYSGPMTQGIYKRGSSSSCNQLASYDGLTTIDGTTVHLDTGATAALYHYTPHFHGNQLFVGIFESWFGPTRGEGYVLATSYLDNGDTRQWVIYRGQRHLVPDQSTLRAWGLDQVTLLQWNGTYLGSYAEGSNISRLMRPTGTQDVYFVDSAKSYKVTSPEMLSAWNFNVSSIIDVPIYLGQLPSNSGMLSYSVRNSIVNNGPVYAIDGGTTRQYLSPDILYSWEGDNTPIIALSNDYISLMGSGSTIISTKVSKGTSGAIEYQVVAGQKLPESVTIAQLYPGVAQIVSAATINRLVTSASASQFVRVVNSSTVYLVDSATKHAVASPEVLRAWGVGANPAVNIVTQSNLNLLTPGSVLNGFEADVSGQLYLMDGRKITIPAQLDSAYRTTNIYTPSAALMSLLPSGETATSFLKGFNSPGVYLLDEAKIRNISSPNQLTLWSNGQGITSISDYVLGQFISGSATGAYITDGTNEYVVESGIMHLVTAPIKNNWQLSNPSILSASTINRFTIGTDLGMLLKNNGKFYIVLGGIAYITVDPNIANVWGLENAPTMSQTIIQEYLPLGNLTRFAKSNVDTRIFIVDSGRLYHLSPSHATNFGLNSQQPIMTIDPSSPSYIIQDWEGVTLRTISGNQYAHYFVVDGGGKRSFPNVESYSYWTNGGLVMTPVSNGFLNLLPNRGIVDRAIKGADSKIYDIHPDANIVTKHWITNPSTFTSQYGRFEQVSDSLINALPTGSAIP